MCGLFASIGLPPDRARIDIVTHRGPDGSGWETFESTAGPVALGHRRLAIIDLTPAGRQPMATPDGRFHLTFNGELYNYVELREDLRSKGEIFTTESDSEVLLRAYAVWGIRALQRFRGMFSFVIWDARDQTLFAARDRFGIKPLYFVQIPGGVALASEIKQLIGLPGLANRMNVARVHDFLASGISDHTAETMFAGVMQVRAGEFLRVAVSGGMLRSEVERWYPATATDLEMSEAEAGRRFSETLREAVRLHLRSDVPVGSCLSGGLDSSSIVCLMDELAGSGASRPELHTFSACYAEKCVDERPFMEEVVAQTGAIPHYLYPRAEDVFARASDITWHQDEPFGSTSIFAQWCVFAEAGRAGIKVMLDGQGADEQLAGYHGSFSHYMPDLMRRRRYAQALRTMLERKRYHGLPLRDQFATYVAPHLHAKAAGLLGGRSAGAALPDWLGTDLIRENGNPKGALALASETLGLPPITDIRSLCLTLTYASNLQMLLHWEDRNSMAHSIEARVPFLDHPLVELSLALGNEHKVVGGDTKRVLRVAMAGTLPENVRQRRDKLGFSTPEQIWFRGPLRGAVQDGIEATLRKYPELMNAPAVRTLASDMLEGRRPVDFTLWRIVNLGMWGERFGVSI